MSYNFRFNVDLVKIGFERHHKSVSKLIYRKIKVPMRFLNWLAHIEQGWLQISEQLAHWLE